jgi:hypothetical protein
LGEFNAVGIGRTKADVLYGCETRSLTLREQHRLRVFENRVLRRIFGLKREKWGRLEKTPSF